jgi:cytochrome c biogenesis protein CcdA
MSWLLLAYMIVAFVAGLIALAMPCCFSVLLPSYFAQSFRQKSKLIGMTVIFSLGISTIMLPIAFGIVAIAQTVTSNHSLVFVIGGFITIILGFWTLWGQGMLPMMNFPVNLNRNDIASVYTLGVFSGAATSCCAPVLAGVLVLAALSTTMIEGLLIGFTYVVGMVFPLFIIALVWDRYAKSGDNPLRGRLMNLNFLGREISIHSSKLIAGILFIIMGIVTVTLGVTGTMIPTPGAAFIGVMRSQMERTLVGFFSSLTTIEGMIILVAVLAVAVSFVLVRNRLKMVG